MDYQLDQVKTEPQESEEYPQQFSMEGCQSVNLYNQENVNEINPHIIPNSKPLPNLKQCEKCVHLRNSMHHISKHVTNCHQLSDDEIIKSETEILDLNSYEVQVLCIEENGIQFQPNEIIHQDNENENFPFLNPIEEREEPLNYGNHTEQTTKYYPLKEINVETATLTTTSPLNVQSSSTKNIWKSNGSRKSENNYCTFCKQSFVNSLYLKKHYNTTSHKKTVKRSDFLNQQGDKTSKGNQCPKQYNSKHKLMYRHSRKKQFTCNLCEKTFATKSHLSSHTNIHTREYTYKCNQCPKQFNQKYNLERHLRLHTGKKPFSCNICGREFIRNDSMIKHKKTHGGEKPHKCDQCSKEFRSKWHLRVHMYVHTGKKPFSCNLCGKQFSTKSKMNVHKITHRKEKPYKCDQCSKQFHQKHRLTRHMYIHTTEKPYRCNICEKGFIEKDSMIKHKCIHTEKNLKSSSAKGFMTKTLMIKYGETHLETNNCVKLRIIEIKKDNIK